MAVGYALAVLGVAVGHLLWRVLGLEARLRTQEALTTAIAWHCQYCGRPNWTADVLWDTVKGSLICASCHNMQSYPDYIKKLDPRPCGRP